MNCTPELPDHRHGVGILDAFGHRLDIVAGRPPWRWRVPGSAAPDWSPGLHQRAVDLDEVEWQRRDQVL